MCTASVCFCFRGLKGKPLELSRRSYDIRYSRVGKMRSKDKKIRDAQLQKGRGCTLLVNCAATATSLALHVDIHNNNNDNAWQRGPLWPHKMGPMSVRRLTNISHVFFYASCFLLWLDRSSSAHKSVMSLSLQPIFVNSSTLFKNLAERNIKFRYGLRSFVTDYTRWAAIIAILPKPVEFSSDAVSYTHLTLPTILRV